MAPGENLPEKSNRALANLASCHIIPFAMPAPVSDMPEDDSALPPEEELTSAHKATYERAWARAYPVLWNWGMRTTSRKMSGPRHDHDREDIVTVAIEQFRRRLMRGEARGKIDNLFQ